MSVRGVLVCYRGAGAAHSAEFTYWDNREQARQAESELTPCGALCIGVHSVVRLDFAPAPRRRTSRIESPT